MVKLLDKKGKGYMDYTDFSQVFTPSMSDSLVTVKKNDTNFQT